MKRFLLITTVLLNLAMMTACTHEEEYSNLPTEINETNSTHYFQNLRTYWQGLHMYVAEGSVTPTNLRLSMINDNADLNFGHGVMFSIEQYLHGEWTQVPFINDAFWIQPLLNVAPKTIVDENISWEHMHGELQPGQYRIVRNFLENDRLDPTPMWQRNIPDAYLYTTFTVVQDWQAAHSYWQSEQDNLKAIAYARFDGLDLEILEYSSRGLSFSLTNNNPYYSYIINSVFVGWEDSFPEGGGAGAVEYFIFARWDEDARSWPFGDEKKLQSGEYLFLAVDWYDEIGHLSSSMARSVSDQSIFDLVIDVTLDVDSEYINENFLHIIPSLPNASHRLRAIFDIS